MPAADEIDLERVICRLRDLRATGARGFRAGGGDWPLRGFVVRSGAEVRCYVNHCPHAGHRLDLQPHHFLTADHSLIVCASHGALFEKEGGMCIAGPCTGQALRAIAVVIRDGLVLLGPETHLEALTSP